MRSKPWGVAALVSAALSFFFSSCDPAGQVGLEVLDTDVPVGASYVEYPAEASTVRRTDSLSTANKDNFLVGTLLDANVGLTTAQAFMQVEPINNPTDTLPAGRVDSLILSLSYAQFYGTADRRQQIAAYEITEAFADDKAYYGESELATSATALGVAHFIPLYGVTKTTRRILAHPWVIGDTITKVDTLRANGLKAVRIPITDAAMKDRLYRAIGTSAMQSLSNFQQVLKGIAIKPYGNTQGTIINFDPLKTSTRMVLHYHIDGDTTRRSFAFQIGNPQSQRYFTRLRTDFSRGTKLTALNPTGLPDEIAATPGNDLTAYLQAGVELGTKLRIPGLDELRAKKGSIIVNRAELFIPTKDYSTGVYGLPARAYLYQLGASNNRPLKLNGSLRTVQANGAAQSGNSSPAVVSYDASQQAYRVLITSFLDAYINDKLPDQSMKSLLLTPTLSATTGLSLSRAIIDAGPNRVKLKVYYSTLQ